MTRAEDDWSAYNKRRKHEWRTFVSEAKRVLDIVGAPRVDPVEDNRPPGRPPYSAKAMVLVNLLRIYLKLSYRDVETMLRSNGQLRRSMGLDGVPTRNTINLHAKLLTEEYLQRFNAQLVAQQKKTSAEQPSMLPVSRSKGTQSVGTLPSLSPRNGSSSTP